MMKNCFREDFRWGNFNGVIWMEKFEWGDLAGELECEKNGGCLITQ